MRTTISLPDALLAQAKRTAASRGTTLSAVVADALRLAFSQALAQGSPPPARRFTLVTFEGRGARPGVDLDRTSTLLELEDLERVAEAPVPYQRAPARDRRTPKQSERGPERATRVGRKTRKRRR